MNPMDGDPKNLELLEPASPETLIPGFSWWLWLIPGGIVVLLGITALIYLRQRKPAVDGIAKRREVAFGEGIAALAAVVTDDVREAAVLCSLILRRYLSVAADDPALYETHEEFVSRHDSLLALTAEARVATAAGFGCLAAMKYAPEPPAVAAAEVVGEARSLLETLHHGFAA